MLRRLAASATRCAEGFALVRSVREQYRASVTTTTLTGKQRRHLRALAHHLEPVVQLGKLGMTDGVVEATRAALDTHELIKVKLGKECPATTDEVSDALAKGTGAHVVGTIGKTLIVYLRHRSEPKITLPRG